MTTEAPVSDIDAERFVSELVKASGPDLARVDRDVTAKGTCMDCAKSFRSFTASTTHAARERHAVSVTEQRVYVVVPRGRQGDLP